MLRALLVAVLVLAGACQTSPGSPLAPVTLGQRPLRPVPAFGSIWVANAADGTVTRVDAATGAIVATIQVADPQRLLAAGCAPSSEHAYATGSFGLRACDAPSAVATGAGSVWAVANDSNAIVRIDPARNAVAGAVPLGFTPWSVTVADDAVWISDYVGDAIVRVDPRTLTVVARVPVAAGPTELALSSGTLWVVGSAAGAVSRIDTTRNVVVATIPVGRWALAIDVGDDDVWVRGGSARDDGGLYRIDVRSNTVAVILQAGAPQGREGVASIAATRGGVWVPGVTLDRIDRTTGAVTGSLAIASYGVARDGSTLWVLDVFGRLVRAAEPP